MPASRYGSLGLAAHERPGELRGAAGQDLPLRGAARARRLLQEGLRTRLSRSRTAQGMRACVYDMYMII